MKYRILRKSSTPFDKVHEECGVFGIAAPEGKEISAAHDAYTALFALQHRGQEAAGIAVNKNGVIHCHKDVGLVSAVFNQEILDNMPGSMAIGHVRYSTTGDTRRENAQPISITHVKGNLAVAHNGNLVNAGELRREIELDGGIFRSSNDTEVLVYTIVKERLKCGSIEEAVMNTMHRITEAPDEIPLTRRWLFWRHETVRGLRVGDSEARFFDLYGSPDARDETMVDLLHVTIENGIVTEIFMGRYE